MPLCKILMKLIVTRRDMFPSQLISILARLLKLCAWPERNKI